MKVKKIKLESGLERFVISRENEFGGFDFYCTYHDTWISPKDMEWGGYTVWLYEHDAQAALTGMMITAIL